MHLDETWCTKLRLVFTDEVGAMMRLGTNEMATDTYSV